MNSHISLLVDCHPLTITCKKKSGSQPARSPVNLSQSQCTVTDSPFLPVFPAVGLFHMGAAIFFQLAPN